MPPDNDVFRLSQSRSKPGDFEIKYYRGIFGLFALAYFISYFIYNRPIPIKEFILPRPLLAIIPLVLLVASYFFKYVKQNISAIAGAFFLLSTLHLMGFFYSNDFKTRFELAIITLILFSNLHLNRVLFVVLYNIIVLSALEYMFIMYSGSGISPLVFFVFVLTVMLICVSYQLYRLFLQRALINREKILTDVFNQSNDAWFLFDAFSGKAVDANFKALSLFEIADEADLEEFYLNNIIEIKANTATLFYLIEQGEYSNKEITCKSKKGNDLSLKIDLSKILDSEELLYCRCVDISRERKQREISEAKALEIRYFLENINAGILVCNDNGIVKLISKNLCELLGYTQQELISDKKLISILNNDLKIDAGTTNNATVFETKYKPLRGQETWLQFSGRKIKSPLDNEENNIWVVKNITEEKQYHAPLAETQPGFNKLFEAGHIGISIIGMDQKILQANAAFCKILGYNEPELKKLSLLDLSHPDDLIRKTDNVQSALEGTGILIKKEKRFIKKDGSVIWTSFSASSGLGNSYDRQMMTMIEDISETKKIENELKLVNTNITSLIESTEDAICSVDFNHNIIVLNTAFIDKFYVEEKVKLRRGMNFKEMLKNEQKEKWQTLHSRVMKGESINEEEVISFFDGSKKYYETSLHPIFSDGNLITGVTYFSRDVTERKKFEVELIKAKEEAERATTIKSQFLATMSHEIRTPLNGLIGMLDLLKTTKLNQKQEEYVDTIQLSGEALLQIINDVLDYSKIESEKLELDAHPFELKKCLEETYDILYYKAQEKNIALLYNIEEGVSSFIIGDKARLRQILINLVSNAIKFTNNGRIVISIKKIKQDDSGLELEFAVKDTGIGISQEQIGRLFTAFSQADVSTFRKYGGTGLGLAISSRLVSLMKGKIWVASKPGEGATFYFTIKTSSYFDSSNKGQKNEKEIEYSKYGTEKKNNVKSSDEDDLQIVNYLQQEIPIKILVAEDNNVNQTVIKILLKRLGYDAVIVSDGLEVLDKLSTEKFDIIFMDVQMPELDGIETTKEIVKILPADKRPVIIAMTAFAMHGDKEQCINAGMDDYISKPIKIEEVEQMIIKWFKFFDDGKSLKQAEDLLSNDLIDQNAIQRIKNLGGEGDTLFLSQVIGMFLKQAPIVINEILENEKNGDIERMWQAAHKLKGSALNIGAKLLAEICRQIEEKGKKSELKDIVKWTSQLKTAGLKTEVELIKFIK